jgi:class I fructose-bisphosphate aldolase
MPKFDVSRKQLVVAMDHGRALGAVQGLEDPGRVIDTVIEAGADAIMTSFGVVKRYRERLIGQIPTILRLDGGPSHYREDWLKYTEWALLHAVADAQDLGVDGVCTMVFMGAAVELETLEITAEVAGECLRQGLPLRSRPCPARPSASRIRAMPGRWRPPAGSASSTVPTCSRLTPPAAPRASAA